MNTATKIAVSIGSIAVIATAGIGGFILATTNTTSPSTATTVTSSSVVPSTSPTSSASTSTDTTSTSSTPSTSSYKDGTYTASSRYYVPHGGSNTVSATVTISGGTITAVTTNDKYTDGESAMYVDSFESNVSSEVVGTSLANASFSRIGGASLTTEGFNSVLDTIRTQATA